MHSRWPAVIGCLAPLLLAQVHAHTVDGSIASSEVARSSCDHFCGIGEKALCCSVEEVGCQISASGESLCGPPQLPSEPRQYHHDERQLVDDSDPQSIPQDISQPTPAPSSNVPFSYLTPTPTFRTIYTTTPPAKLQQRNYDPPVASSSSSSSVPSARRFNNEDFFRQILQRRQGAPCSPNEDEGETRCGSICCASWQQCASDGTTCEAREGFENGGGGGGNGSGMTIIETIGGVVTTRFSAPFRITGTATVTSTPTGGAGGGGGGGDGDGDGDDTNGADDGGGLSGGAIAGIVIGALAGLALLGLLCFCCVAKGIIGAFGKKDKSSTTSYSHTTPSSYYQGHQHSSWYGSSSSSSDGGKGKKLLGLAALVTAVMVFLRMKKKKEVKKKPRAHPTTTTGVSYSYTGSEPSRTHSSVSYSGSSEMEEAHSRTQRTTYTRRSGPA